MTVGFVPLVMKHNLDKVKAPVLGIPKLDNSTLSLGYGEGKKMMMPP